MSENLKQRTGTESPGGTIWSGLSQEGQQAGGGGSDGRGGDGADVNIDAMSLRLNHEASRAHGEEFDFYSI